MRAAVAVAAGLLLSAQVALGATPAAATGEPAPRPEVLSARAAAPATTSLPAAVFQARLLDSLSSTATASKYLGPALSGLVIDRETGQTVWSSNLGSARLPASTQKVITAYTVLRSLPLSTQFVTTVNLEGPQSRTIYLRGGGDPSLGPLRFKALAENTARDLLARGLTSARLQVDDTALPPASLANGWKTSYLAGDVQYVRGLTLYGYRGADGTLAAGKVFAAHLTKLGITTKLVGRAVTPSSSLRVATSASAPVSQLLAVMLSESNNDYAEYLSRHAARAGGKPATFAGAAAQQRSVLASAGVPLSGFASYDGSGLSRSDRMPVATMAAVLNRLLTNDTYRDVAFGYGAMPRAGQTGTLRSRFATPYQACARGRVLAKTGTLNGVVGLAGLAKGSDQRDRIFVLLNNGSSDTSKVRSAIDTMATIVVGCQLG